ncbi:MAG: M23 family metallopeptidase [Alphaproteobacteria bacterium]
MKAVLVVSMVMLATAAAAAAEPVTLDGRFTQGGLVIGRVAPGSRVAINGGTVMVSGDGVFLLGFGRDAPPTARLEVTLPDGSVERKDLAVEPRTYDVQRITGLPPAQVTPSPAALERIRAEAETLRQARRKAGAITHFLGGFVWPADGPVSGIYGSQRILNGEPRAPHVGLDIAGPTGTPVRATAAGTVVLAAPDFFFTGMTVVIEHGHGLTSIYAHMSALAVRPGDRVNAGDPIGAIGATGRVTGAHLHWGINLFEVALDPALLVLQRP